MNRQMFTTNSDIVRGVVWVWMPDTVRTDSLHHTLIVAPVQRPRSHVVVRWVVDAAVFSAALRFIVRFKECVYHNVALTRQCSEWRPTPSLTSALAAARRRSYLFLKNTHQLP